MKIVIIFLALLFASPAICQAPDVTFLQKLLTVEKPWDRLIRKAFGCPPAGETTVDNCKPELGSIDYVAFRKSCEAAKDLFKLEGSCTK